ncbi:MAG TPA: YdeI/OmpD-associated family protein [Steroidobacteraceae bacterium]
MASNIDSSVVACVSEKEWARWLATNHADSKGVWLRFFKKASGTASVNHREALAIALCYGWIDGQLKKYDGESWLRKFTPRRPKSIWSKRNREIVEQLVDAGKMKTAGLKEIAAAKEDGRWDRAYDSPSKMTVPGEFVKAIAKNKKARQFFKTLSKANIYAIAWRLQTAKKPETRDKRMKAIIAMLAKGKAFHA